MRWNLACRIVVIDGQGGKIGRQLVESIRLALPEAEITAVGTNSAATSNMLKGGARSGATGENAVRVACREADICMCSGFLCDIWEFSPPIPSMGK